jgi:hypothetical protein
VRVHSVSPTAVQAFPGGTADGAAQQLVHRGTVESIRTVVDFSSASATSSAAILVCPTSPDSTGTCCAASSAADPGPHRTQGARWPLAVSTRALADRATQLASGLPASEDCWPVTSGPPWMCPSCLNGCPNPRARRLGSAAGGPARDTLPHNRVRSLIVLLLSIGVPIAAIMRLTAASGTSSDCGWWVMVTVKVFACHRHGRQ